MNVLKNVVVDDTFNDNIDLNERHKTEPIKSIEHINAIYNYFIGKGKYRDAALFTVAINTGLRIGDIRLLNFAHFFDRNWQRIRDVYIVEEKTKETRGDKRLVLTQKFYREHAHLSNEDLMKVVAKMINEGMSDYNEKKKQPPKKRYVYANDRVFEVLELLIAIRIFPPLIG